MEKATVHIIYRGKDRFLKSLRDPVSPEKEMLGAHHECAHIPPRVKEKRMEHRRMINLTGGYISLRGGKRGLISLVNISHSGLRYQLNSERSFYLGDKHLIMFTLDDFKKSVIRREAMLININGRYIGAAFSYPGLRDGLTPYLAHLYN